jgi:hypothetical protein
VEQYLFQSFDWTRFYGNVSNLPLDPSSTFIRSVSSSSRATATARPFNARFLSLLSSMTEIVDEYAAGRIREYDDVIRLSR